MCTQSMWPRDVLLRYLLAMEELENNQKEYSELQMLAAATLHQLMGTIPHLVHARTQVHVQG